MEILTKMELQKYSIDQIDALFNAADLDTFESILKDLTDRLEALTFSRHSNQELPPIVTFWKAQLPEWLKWKYIHGHTLEFTCVSYSMKHTFCHPISYSELPGEAYSYQILREMIDEKTFGKR